MTCGHTFSIAIDDGKEADLKEEILADRAIASL